MQRKYKDGRMQVLATPFHLAITNKTRNVT
jgi:hypothetical protein